MDGAIERQDTTRKRKTLNLALRGGGAHGAFTWSVLDRLPEEDWLDIGGISGAGAGAGPGIIRRSIGLENVGDLILDLE